MDSSPLIIKQNYVCAVGGRSKGGLYLLRGKEFFGVKIAKYRYITPRIM